MDNLVLAEMSANHTTGGEDCLSDSNLLIAFHGGVIVQP